MEDETIKIERAAAERKKTLRAFVDLLALVPPVLLAYFIYAYGVNHPFWDQWEIAALFPKAANGTLSLRDLFAQHNESRKVFPRLIFLLLGRLSGWNVKWEMAASAAAAGATMCAIVFLHRRTRDANDIFSAVAVLTASVLIFLAGSI